MSVTCPVDPTKPYADHPDMPGVESRADLTREEAFVPVYARSGKSRAGRGKVRSWMILAPVGAIVLGGIGALMFMGGNEEAGTPLAEPATTPPVLSALPAPVDATTAPLTPTPTLNTAPAAPAPTPTPAPTPVIVVQPLG